MNNKGQSLVLFVLLIPLLFMILYMVYEISLMVKLKEEIDNINYLVINFNLDKIEDDNIETKIKDMIIKNKSDVFISLVEIKDNKLYITLEDKLDNKIFNNMEIFRVKSSYVGYIEDNKKIIERAK